MSLDQTETALLSAHDDDYYGLWEIDWHFNGTHPDWPHGTRNSCVARLVQKGFLDVFLGPFLSAREPLPLNAALVALTNPSAWAPPADGQEMGYYVTTSQAGISALRTSTS